MRGCSVVLFALRSTSPVLKVDMVHAVITCATSRKFAGSSTRRAASAQMSPHLWRSRQSRISFARTARRCRPRTSTRKWQLRWAHLKVSNLATLGLSSPWKYCTLPLQVDAALSAEQLRQSLQTAFQQKDWRWAYLLRMAMTFMPATLGRSDDLRKLPWSCLALRPQDSVGPVPSVAILCGKTQGKTVKPGQVDIPGFVR